MAGEVLPRHIAITAWAFGTLCRARALGLKGADLGGILRPLADAAASQLPEFDGQSLGNLLWGFAVCRYVDKRILSAATRRGVTLLHEGVLRHQNLANVLWAYATARFPNPTLFAEVAKVDLWSAGDFSSQHVTNILWAFSRIHGKQGIHGAFFNAAAEASVPKLNEFKTQELSNICWSFANQTLCHERLFAAVARCSVARIQEFDTFDLSQLLWAFAKVWFRDEELFSAAAAELMCRRRFDRMSSQDIGCILWAFAMVQWDDARLFEALADASLSRLADLKPLDVGNAVWALSAARRLDIATAKTVAEHVLERCRISAATGGGARGDPGREIGRGANAWNQTAVDRYFKGDWGETAEGWVHTLDALRHCRDDLDGRWELLESIFAESILRPLSHRLANLQEGAKECFGAVQRLADSDTHTLAASRQMVAEFTTWTAEMQLEHLGPAYTRDVAAGLHLCDAPAAGEEPGLGFQAPWVGEGRAALEAYTLVRGEDEHTARIQSSVGPKPSRVGLHQSKVVAWIAYEIQLQLPGAVCSTTVAERGRVVPYGRADREYSALWQISEKLLQAVQTSHTRAGHAERVAMLHVMCDLLRAAESRASVVGTVEDVDTTVVACGYSPASETGLTNGEAKRLLESINFKGELRLFVSHWPCVSCVAVLCQFTALCPGVHVRAAWDGFSTHSEPHAPPPGGLSVASAESAGGCSFSVETSRRQQTLLTEIDQQKVAARNSVITSTDREVTSPAGASCVVDSARACGNQSFYGMLTTRATVDTTLSSGQQSFY
eukprot:TRINITY_DN37639_c0_g2_i1.p1 TRINITY_DN37639_c0_g2~~TRINITY_DN37639_c0_g2_i1.p1  ORF type:complete len:829 (-),score=124.08 TRINITY_DN37639_c0_g2_i1:8-2353(-)